MDNIHNTTLSENGMVTFIQTLLRGSVWYLHYLHYIGVNQNSYN